MRSTAPSGARRGEGFIDLSLFARAGELRGLWYPASTEDLAAKHARSRALFAATQR